MNHNIGLSKGIAIGSAFPLRERIEPSKIMISDTKGELEKLHRAIQNASDRIELMLNEKSGSLTEEQEQILNTHKMLIEDDEFRNQIEAVISEESCNASFAVLKVANAMAAMFKALENAYLRERAADMKDIGWQVIDVLEGNDSTSEQAMQEGTIVVAHDLTPSDTVRLDLSKVTGFITETGGVTSHSAIIARSLNIPAIKCGGALKRISSGAAVIIDGEEGLCIVNPDEETLKKYGEEVEQQLANLKLLERYRDVEVKTTDGHKVEVVGNIVTADLASEVLRNGGTGVGLYRSEFLYMATEEAPDEQLQFEAYKSVVEAMEGNEVVVRTLDVGGDKEIGYLGIEKEANPFLGYRAIRYCLGNESLFKVQIRALLRASHYGDIRIMLPMIGTVEELRAAKRIIDVCKKELDQEAVPYNEAIQVGIMIEVPSAAVMSYQLAQEADFFSIGTNDLIGYTMAADRMNDQVAYLYTDLQPSVLNLIQMTISNGHRAGIKVSMCGNSAANEALIALYLGMGLDKFSVNPSEILKVKKTINALEFKASEGLAKKVTDCNTVEAVKDLII